ncbi:expressed unknown protein [Seminavis robusta]|uniref:Uncharacterized protein n=1 Tax=Seminavis robusta TaxID=568900 RepID=A0A9N8EFJ2_9STRA|nr:expressed unknown protein [Seminavis robusta]|eukprot:Sro917_g219910.1 n/a (98) ;mRNA; r:21609-21902
MSSGARDSPADLAQFDEAAMEHQHAEDMNRIKAQRKRDKEQHEEKQRRHEVEEEEKQHRHKQEIDRLWEQLKAFKIENGRTAQGIQDQIGGIDQDPS